MKTENKYISIEKTASKNKTDIYAVINKSGQYPIGTIYWYGAWRQYCFDAYLDMVFNSECLELITDFLKDINVKHRSNWKQKIGEEI